MFRLIVAAALIWAGSQSLFTAFQNPSPSEFTIEEFATQKPKKHWLTISGGYLNLLEASYSSSRFGGEDAAAKELFIPLRTEAALDEEAQPVPILVATSAPAVLDVFNRLNRMKDETEVMTFLAENKKDVFQQRTVSGLVRFGIDLDDDEVQKLRQLNGNLTKDFVILDEGSKPSWAPGLLVPLGVGMLAWQFWPRRREA